MTEQKQKIAILSVSAGAGHVRAAQALEEWAEREYPNLEITHIDVMDMVPKLFRKVYAESYIKVVDRHPELWGFLYHRTDVVAKESSGVRKLRVALEQLNTRKLMKALQKLGPDQIICTHFLPAELLSRMIGNDKLNSPCWVQVTDFDVHALWVHSHMAGYFAACDEVAWRMRDRHIPKSTIHVTGIPISPAFSQKLDRAQCAGELGIDPERKAALLMSGGVGVGGIDHIAERLLKLKLKEDFQIVALAGRNEELLTSLQQIAEEHPGRLFPMGFTSTIERVMACADIAISKPGGLTTSECLAMGLPMIVISPIPGQEERNADYLLENGAAMKAHDEAGLEFRLMDVLKNPDRLATMAANARRISTPTAARDVLDTVLGRLPRDTDQNA